MRIANFFTEVFTQVVKLENEHLYKLTAAIAETFLIAQTQCGIVYPTIAMRANAENFAFTLALVDQNLQLESANWYRVDAAEDFSYTLTSLAYANSFSLDGQITWRLPTEEEKSFYRCYQVCARSGNFRLGFTRP